MYQLIRLGMFLCKWVRCSWLHRKYRCYPQDFKYWHCRKCHRCGEELDILFGYTQDNYPIKGPLNWKQKIIRRKIWKDV